MSNLPKERLEEWVLLGQSTRLDRKKKRKSALLLGWDLEEISINLAFKSVVNKKKVCVSINMEKSKQIYNNPTEIKQERGQFLIFSTHNFVI